MRKPATLVSGVGENELMQLVVAKLTVGYAELLQFIVLGEGVAEVDCFSKSNAFTEMIVLLGR